MTARGREAERGSLRGREGRGRGPGRGRCGSEIGAAKGLRGRTGHGVMVASCDLIAEHAQAWEGSLLALMLGDIEQGSRAAGLGLGRAEHLFVGLELELEGAVAVGQDFILGFGGAELLLRGLVLLLQSVDQLLQLHAADLRLQFLGQLGADLLLADEVHDDGQHEINQVDGALDNVFLGLGQALGRVPAGTLQEKVVDPAVQLAVQLAEVLAAIALGDAVLLALVIRVGRDGAALALASAELL